jgi:hypothetical protein
VLDDDHGGELCVVLGEEAGGEDGPVGDVLRVLEISDGGVILA